MGLKADAAQLERCPGRSIGAGTMGWNSRMRILLAEDERELATWLVRALKQSDFQVDWVDDGRLVGAASKPPATTR